MVVNQQENNDKIALVIFQWPSFLFKLYDILLGTAIIHLRYLTISVLITDSLVRKHF